MVLEKYVISIKKFIDGFKDFFLTFGKRSLSKNVQYYYLYYFSTGFLFSIPIWVLFYRRVLDFPQLAFLTVFQSIITTVLEIPTGALADLLGRRKTVLIGLLISAGGVFGIAFSNTFTQFIICQIATGIGAAFVSGADGAILYDSLKELGREDEYGKVALKSGFLYRIGLIVASFTGGYLYDIWISLPYIMKALSMVAGAFWMYFMIEPHIDSEKFSWTNYVKQTKQGVREITKSAYIKKLTIYYILIGGITWSCLYYFSQPFALDFGYTDKEMSILFGLIYLFTTVILYVLTSIPNLLTRERVYIGFPIIMILSFLPAYIIPKMFAPLLILGVQIVGSGRFAILDKYTNKEFEPKNRSTANSTINMMIEIFMIITVQVGGYIQGISNTKLIYSLLGVLTLIFVTPFAIQLVNEHRASLQTDRA